MSGTKPRRLNVLMEGIVGIIGILEDDFSQGGFNLKFTYADGYNGPPLSGAMRPYNRSFGNAQTRSYFDNLLPEGEPRRNITGTNNRTVDEDDVVGLLEVIGGDCPGSVMVLPTGSPPTKIPGELKTDYEPLSDNEVENILLNAAAGLEPGEREKASLPGVQRKVALVYDEQHDMFYRPKERCFPTTHILKVAPKDAPSFDGVVANELLCMRIAHAVGLPVAKVHRMEFGKIECLLVDRYDRLEKDGKYRRIHQEDATQALGLDRSFKYEDRARAAGKDAGLNSLLGTFAGLTALPADTRDILRRAVFLNWLIGNNDAHLKNFSLLHHKGVTSLAPLYDIVSTEALPGRWTGMAMSMGQAITSPSVTGSDINFLAQHEGGTRRKASPSAVKRRLNAFNDIASQVVGAIKGVIENDEVSSAEAEPILNLVISRILHLNNIMNWSIKIELHDGVKPRR
jgi:serine/threonine-protein kinase HipA